MSGPMRAQWILTPLLAPSLQYDCAPHPTKAKNKKCTYPTLLPEKHTKGHAHISQCHTPYKTHPFPIENSSFGTLPPKVSDH